MAKIHGEEIHWIDSFGCGGWHMVEEAVETAKGQSPECVSLGYVYYEDDTRVAIAQSVGPNGQMMHLSFIPKVAITKRRRVR